MTNADSAHNAKKRQFKKKIIEQKAMIDNLVAVVKSREAAMEENARKAEQFTDSLKDELNRVKEDHVLQIKEIEHEGTRKLMEANNNHKVAIADMQLQYQEMIDSRIRELQTTNSEQLSRAKDTELELRAKIQDIHHNMELNYILKTTQEETLEKIKAEHFESVQQLKHEIDIHVEKARQAEVE